jgi:hypothetical protein
VRRLLCWLGLHNWYETQWGKWPAKMPQFWRECLGCGRQQRATLHRDGTDWDDETMRVVLKIRP